MIEKYIKNELRLPQNPIFIVGFPRSGTTLIQSLILTQKEIISFPETHFFLSIYDLIEQDKQNNVIRAIGQNVYQKISEKINLDYSKEEKKEILRLIESRKITVKDFFEILILKSIGRNYELDQLCNYRWLEKTPYHAFFLDKIFHYYPQAQVIHVLRHPLAVICSIKAHFTDTFPDIGQLSYEALAQKWLEFIFCIDRFAQRHPHKIFSVKYEDIVGDLINEMVRVFYFLNLHYDLSLLKNFQAETDKIIQPWEKWKTNNRNEDIADMNEKYKGLKNREIIKAGEILKTKMDEYNYHIDFD